LRTRAAVAPARLGAGLFFGVIPQGATLFVLVQPLPSVKKPAQLGVVNRAGRQEGDP